MSGAEWLSVVVTGVAIAAGIVGTLIPVLPGLILVWAATLVYGLLTDFGPVGWVAMTLITILLGLGTFVSYKIPQRRVAAAGVQKSDQFLGLVLAIVGFFVLPIVGLVVGFALGIFLAQYLRTRDGPTSRRATKEALIGMLQSAAAQAAIGLVMAAIWVVWVVANAIG